MAIKYRKRFHFFICIFFSVFIFAHDVYAACTNPVGVQGEIILNEDTQMFQGCGTGGWIEFNAGAMPPSCTLDGVTVGHGFSRTFYNSNNDNNCPGASLLRECAYGTLSGSAAYQYADCVDNTPDAFAFVDVTGTALSTLTLSNIVQISGIASGAAISISGGGEYRICADAACTSVLTSWTSSGETVQNNQYLQLRLTSSAAYTTAVNTTVTVGASSDTWSVTTLAQDTAPNAFSFTDQTGVAVSTLTSSDIVQISGITGDVATSISGSGGEYRICSDAACASVVTNWTTGASTIQNNQYAQLRMTSSASTTATLNTTFTVGSGNDTWSVTTVDDDTPNAFSFTDQTGVALSTVINSNILQISGITGNIATSISGSGASYRICSDASCASVITNWTTGASTIQNNQYLQLRMTSSASFLTGQNTTMTVGTGSDTWSVTTEPQDVTPAAFAFTDEPYAEISTNVTSNILQITSITGDVATSIAGGGSYRICSNSDCSTVVTGWTTGASTIQNNQYLQLRYPTPATYETAVNTTVTVGTESDTWNLTTREKHGLELVTDLGLTSGLKMFLDAGAGLSANPSTNKWLDLSGNGTDFNRGAGSGSEGTDPTFTGVANRMSGNDYWSFDGGDYFTYDSGSETWMNNLHKNNARFTVCQWVRYSNNSGYRAVFNTRNGWAFASGNGVEFNAMSSGDGDRYYVRVTSTSGWFSAVMDYQSTHTSSVGSWHFICVSVNEASSSVIISKNGSAQSTSASYSSPSSGSAQFPMRMGLTDVYLPSGSRVGMWMAWEGNNLSAAQMDDIFQATRGRYGI